MQIRIRDVMRYRRCHRVLMHSGVPEGQAWIVLVEAIRGRHFAMLWIKLAFACRHMAPAPEWL